LWKRRALASGLLARIGDFFRYVVLSQFTCDRMILARVLFDLVGTEEGWEGLNPLQVSPSNSFWEGINQTRPNCWKRSLWGLHWNTGFFLCPRFSYAKWIDFCEISVCQRSP
jgi:hypothetical protein